MANGRAASCSDAWSQCTGGYRDGSDAFQAVRLKASESPVDIASLVNGIAGWFYRTVVFQSYHVEKVKPARGLGRPLSIDADLPLVRELAGNARVLTIDGVWGPLPGRRAAEYSGPGGLEYGSEMPRSYQEGTRPAYRQVPPCRSLIQLPRGHGTAIAQQSIAQPPAGPGPSHRGRPKEVDHVH